MALLCDDEILYQKSETVPKGQAERLFPLLEEALEHNHTTWNDLDTIAVGIGPGNFTGVRIAVSAARALALSLSIPAIGVSKLEAMAYGQSENCTCILNARRDRIYTQNFIQNQAPSSPILQQISEFKPKYPIIFDHNEPEIIPLFSKGIYPIHLLAKSTALVALRRFDQKNPRPAPLYLREPDAAIAREPLPIILP